MTPADAPPPSPPPPPEPRGAAPGPEDNPWTVKAVRRVYDTPWIGVDHADVVTPAGNPGIYGLVRFKNRAVGVLPIEEDGAVHLVGQYRLAIGRYSWEMPEGGAPVGESVEACARRELEEEAGLVAGRLEQVLHMHLSNSVSDEEAFCFLAFDLRPGAFAPDETEVLRHRRIPFLAALAEALDGRITDSLTVATLLRAHHMATIGALPPELTRTMLGR
ncbi:MAG: NUDIX hydrolase [Alphaproteobacteria bacterium]|nr:NUDIX hydrolase [Alphaproteobacteria bacterium]